MNTFHDLARRVDGVAAPTLDLDGLIAQGEHRLRRRRVAATMAAVAVVAVTVVGGLAASGLRHQSIGPVSPTEPFPPTPSLNEDAAQIIAEGTLESFAATESGTVLTVWAASTCEDWVVPDCGVAWRLGTGSQPQATGMVGRGDAGVDANAFGDGFVLTPAGHRLDRGFRIDQDGIASRLPLSRVCRDVTWSTSTELGRLVWGPGMSFVDTVAGVICDTGRLGGRLLAGDGVFTGDGALWALVDNETGPKTLTIGRYDGLRWRYRDLAAEGGSWTSELAAAGSNIVVLVANSERAPAPDRLLGLSVSTDAGATWSEVVDPDALDRDLPFSRYVAPNSEDWFSGYTSMAFAGTSALYVADGNGDLWRSTDFATFSRVSVPGGVEDLKSAGNAVIARIDSAGCAYPGTCQLNDLIRISADGSVEPITVR
jgi:hypothetical protein